EVPVCGCEPAALDLCDAPWCPPGPVPTLAWAAARVGDELPVEGVADPALEAAHGFGLGLAVGEFAPVVGPARQAKNGKIKESHLYEKLDLLERI
ncbi:hypothetical protein, partial [Intrasporangium chromatireducens]|uniref:hypothetical protein n=1 Tax=Intrasporangium chromatireducens TaxID=1386088 RepID=UPI001969B5A0